jgi:hypothetical protein
MAVTDVWALRRCWPREKKRIKGKLLFGNYRFSQLSRITLKDGEDTERKHLGFTNNSAARFWPPLRLRCTTGDGYGGRGTGWPTFGISEGGNG